jgi:hypothetical protein
MDFWLMRNHIARSVDVDLAVITSNEKQLRTPREKFRRTALIGLNVRMIVTNNALKGLAQLGERKRIRSSPVENQISVAIGFENIPHQFPNTTRPFVIAIGNGCAVIGLFQRGQDLGANPGRVIARELVMLIAALHVDLANRGRDAQQTTIPLKREIA